MVAQGKAIDRISPSKASLYQHAKRPIKQARSGQVASLGFRRRSNQLIWDGNLLVNSSESEMPEASKECHELIKCKCRKGPISRLVEQRSMPVRIRQIEPKLLSNSYAEHNHETSHDLFERYIQQGKLTGSEKVMSEELVRLGITTQKI
ncbi:hypothetical protein ElyMa_002964200 [Elysia marginata]|uniref:Uncharacterized protein n=1 Tax=Elysia marginata TaxID=1093978 RepID=A0AAV4I8Y8_9GAST|nr:hypothetical protein ElyMa_002964200 [Elysia marginata]